MKASEVIGMLGLKLQEKYAHLGFKYKKSDRTVTKHSKKFTYMIVFYSFEGNTKDNIRLDTRFIVNHRPYDLTPGANSQALYYSLWENEIYLNIADDEKIEETYKVVCEWMEKMLIPKMNELEKQ